MKAIANHTLEIEANFRGPLPGTETLPLQRWTFVGGSGTLYTFDIAEFRGDRLAFVGVAQTSELYQTNPVDGQARVLSSPGGSNVLDFDFISVGS